MKNGHQTRISESDIAAEARGVQIELWKASCETFNGGASHDPLQVLEPATALERLGFEVHQVPTLGETHTRGRRMKVAGTINLSGRVVQLATDGLTKEEKYFTLAHELGHAKLHPGISGLHRDRPFDQAGWHEADPREREANSFAAHFLMPEKQIRRCFRSRYSTDRFFLNDHTAFALGAKRDRILANCRTVRNLSLLLARTTTYAGHNSRSLAEQFGVSPTAMAIRLERLDLVESPQW